MIRLFFKLVLATTLGAAGLFLMYYQQEYLRENFDRNGAIMVQMQSLDTDVVALKHAVLQANFFLYFNNDAIYRGLKRIDERLASLFKTPSLSIDFPATYASLSKLKSRYEVLRRDVNRFLTYNASLKNSSIYLPTLALKAYEVFDRKKEEDSRIILLLSKINASLFLAKNALDEAFIDEIKRYRNRLVAQMDRIKDPKQERLLKTTLRHMDLFIELFPAFRSTLAEIIDMPVEREVARAIETFSAESKRRILKVNHVAELFTVLYLFMAAAIVYFVIHVEKESLIDGLTGLGNRKAYSIHKERYDHPVLLLVNIDRFKHINEYYGAKVGDRLLKMVAVRLPRMVPKGLKARVYRMGGDDFGVLFAYRGVASVRETIRHILRKMDDALFEIDDIPPIEISVTIGASDRKERLFETADMALKEAKSASRRRFVIYSDTIDKSEQIARNIAASKQLKRAIAEGRVVPYFQPIVQIKDGRVTKYEALARIRLENGEILKPDYFLEAAKLTKLSGAITQLILRKTLETARLTGEKFSVNVSATDIAADADRAAIFALLERHGTWARHITFEILESEEVKDYDEVAAFIDGVKRYGAAVAIDDFGSGYSNFEKLLQLDLDILKIDGSLIRNIDHDDHSRMVVETMVGFAAQAGLRTIAEYVHSKEVLQKVEAMGITCAQGYYLGKPAPAEEYFKKERR